MENATATNIIIWDTADRIEQAPFGWYHVRAIAVAGIGFFTDA